MWEFTTTSPFYGAKFGVVLCVLCFIQVLINEKIELQKSTLVGFLIICIAFLIYAMATRYNAKLFVTAYMGLFIAFFFYSSSLIANNQIREFFLSYLNVVLIISICSLFFWIFGSLLDVLPGKDTLEYHWANSYLVTFSWKGLYFENPIQNIGQPMVRNMGVFTEAPAYSAQLIYALLIENVLFYEKDSKTINSKKARHHRIRSTILAVTLISTLSTKGLIALCILILFKVLFWKCRDAVSLGTKVILATSGLFVATIIGAALVLQKLGTGSGAMRVDDVSAYLKTWSENPLFGAGYFNSSAVAKYFLVSRSSEGLSMGITVMLAWGGIWLMAIYACALIRSRMTSWARSNGLLWWMIVAVLTYNLLISNCGFSNAYVFLLAFAYVVSIEPTGTYSKNAINN